MHGLRILVYSVVSFACQRSSQIRLATALVILACAGITPPRPGFAQAVLGIYNQGGFQIANGQGAAVGAASPGDPIAIVGSGFGATQGSGYVLVSGSGGSFAPGVTADLKWSDTQIAFIFPILLPWGTYQLSLVAADGQNLGPYTLQIGANSATNPGAPAQIVIARPDVKSPANRSVTAGEAFDVKVTVEDAFGNITPQYRGTMSFHSSDDLATMEPVRSGPSIVRPRPINQVVAYVFTQADAGSKTFSVTYWTPGRQTFSTKDTANADLAQATSFLVASGPAAAITATISNDGLVGNSAIAGLPVTLSLVAKSSLGVTATGNDDSLVISTTDAAATDASSNLIGTKYTSALKAGVLSLSIDFRTPGPQQILVTDSSQPSLSPPAIPINVYPVFKLTQQAIAPQGTGIPLAVSAVDWNGNVLAKYAGVVQLVDDTLAPAFGPTYQFVPAKDQGMHVFTLPLGTTGFVGAEDVAFAQSLRGIYLSPADTSTVLPPLPLPAVPIGAAGLSINVNAPCAVGYPAWTACNQSELDLPSFSWGGLSGNGQGNAPYAGPNASAGGITTGYVLAPPPSYVMTVASPTVTLPVTCQLSMSKQLTTGPAFAGNEIGCFVKVQELTACDANPTNPPITFTQYNQFCWKDLASTTINFLVPQANWGTAQNYPNSGSVTFTLDQPMDVIQIVWDYSLGDSQVGESVLYGAPCVNGNAGCAQTTPLESVFAIGPIVVQVAPVAAIQLNIMPVAIMYQPPGGDSYQTYQVGASMTTSVISGSSSTKTQISNWGASQSVAYNFKENPSFTIPGTKFQIGGSGGISPTQSWSGSTQNITSTTNSNSESQVLSYQTNAAFSTAVNNVTAGKGDPNMLVPGYEPFWDDVFLLALYPQFEVWNFGGNWLWQLAAADVAAAYPATVTDLAACAVGTGWTLPPIFWVNSNTPLVVQPETCQQLLAMDPYYAWGQAAEPLDFSPIGPEKSSLTPVSNSNLATGTLAQTSTVSNSLTTSVTDTIGSSLIGSLSITIPFFGGGVTATSGETQSNTDKLSLTYDYKTDLKTGSSQQSGFYMHDEKNTEIADVFIDPRFNTYTFGIPQPTISQILPASGPMAGGASIAVCGLYFDAGAQAVAFPAAVAGQPLVDATITPLADPDIIGPFQIDANTPAGPSGSAMQPVPISVATSGGWSVASSTAQYTYLQGASSSGGFPSCPIPGQPSPQLHVPMPWQYRLEVHQTLPQNVDRATWIALTFLIRHGILAVAQPIDPDKAMTSEQQGTLTQAVFRHFGVVGQTPAAGSTRGTVLAEFGHTLLARIGPPSVDDVSAALARYTDGATVAEADRQDVGTAILRGLAADGTPLNLASPITTADYAKLALRFASALQHAPPLAVGQ